MRMDSDRAAFVAYRVAAVGWRHGLLRRWWLYAALLALGTASAQPFSVALSVAPLERGGAIVAAAATADVVNFGAARLRARGDVAFAAATTAGGALVGSVQQDGVDLYAGLGVGVGALATADTRETFIAPYWLIGLRAPLAFGVGMVFEARATPRWGPITFAFGIDVGFGR